MVTLARTTTGLLYQSDGTLTGWTNGGSWTSVSDPVLVPFAPSPVAFGGSTPNGYGSDEAGTRQGMLFVESSSAWWLQYDSWDHVPGSAPHVSLAASSDRGLSWLKYGADPNNKAGAAGATLNGGSDTGWLCKLGSTYYRFRVTAGAASSYGPYYNFGSSPYGIDQWSASALPGTWTGIQAIPAAAGTWANSNCQPGTVYYDGSTYHLFVTANNSGGAATVGRYTASTPGGTYTAAASGIATTLAGYTQYENPRVFFHSGLSKYALLLNTIDAGGTHTDHTILGLSSSLTDWSAATWRLIQRPCPMDGLNVVGVMSHVSTPDNGVVTGPNGEVPVTYDTDPNGYSPGWHLGRRVRCSVLEPAANGLHYAGAGDTTARSLSRSLSHTDVVIEFAWAATAFNGSAGAYLWVDYRSDGAGNGYRAKQAAATGLWSLYKVVSGTETLLASGSGSYTPGGTTPYITRFKIKASGTTHTAYVDGDPHYSATDATYSSGTTVALTGAGVAATVWLFSARTSDTVTIAGLNPSQSCWLRTFGGWPAGSVLADSSGSGTFSHTHSPLWGVELSGTDYTPSGGIWGGDTLTFSGVPAAAPAPKTRSLALGRV